MGSLVFGRPLYSVKQDHLPVIRSPHKCVGRHRSFLNGIHKTVKRTEMPSRGWPCPSSQVQKLCDRWIDQHPSRNAQRLADLP